MNLAVMTTYVSDFLLKTIQFGLLSYQKTLSPDHGFLRALFPAGACRYRPTCSQYTSQAISHYKWNGLTFGLKRILRCHPFASGGYDPLPAPDAQPTEHKPTDAVSF